MQVVDALSRLSPEEDAPMPDLNVQIHDVCPLKRVSAKDPCRNSWRPRAFCPQVSCGQWLGRHSKGTAPTGTTLLDLSRRIVYRRQIVLQRPPNYYPAGPPGRYPIQTTFQPPRYREDQVKSTHISILEEPEQEHRRNDQVMFDMLGTPAQSSKGTSTPNRSASKAMAHSMNLFYADDDEFLSIADYYTKYPFVRKIPKSHSTSKCVADLTKQILCEQGILWIVWSDNGPHFQGYYRQLAEAYGFSHVTSSPNDPRSNGFIESQVKNVKKVQKKAQRSNSDPNISVQPQSTTNYHPRQSCCSDDRYRTTYLGKSKATRSMMMLSTDCKGSRHNRSITVISTLLFYLAWFQDSKWPFRTPRYWSGSQMRYWIRLGESLGLTLYPRQVARGCAETDPK